MAPNALWPIGAQGIWRHAVSTSEIRNIPVFGHLPFTAENTASAKLSMLLSTLLRIHLWACVISEMRCFFHESFEFVLK